MQVFCGTAYLINSPLPPHDLIGGGKAGGVNKTKEKQYEIRFIDMPVFMLCRCSCVF